MRINWRFPWQKKSSSMDVLRDFMLQSSSKTGIPINHKTALQSTVALACARVIAEGIAQVPLKLFQKRLGGGADARMDHPLYSVLHDSPNGWQTSFEWRESMALHLIFSGNGYSQINRPVPSVIELLPYEPSQVKVEQKPDWSLKYEVRQNDGTLRPVDQKDMLHLRGPSWNTWDGLDCVKLAREAIGLSLAEEEHGARFFKNGATLGGILTTDQNLTSVQRDELRESWKARHEGGANAYKTGLLWGGLKWLATGIDNEKSQLIEARKFQVEEVCRAFRVLPVMVGYSDKATTYGSAEQMFLAHVVHTLGPWYVRLEQGLDKRLLSDEERAQGFYFKFDPRGMMRGAHADRASYYKTMREIGVMNANEIRALEDMNPYDAGDEYIYPMNMMPVGDERNERDP
jgi:HK97 family phage portal protein